MSYCSQKFRIPLGSSWPANAGTELNCVSVFTLRRRTANEKFLTAINTRQVIVGFFQPTGKIFTEELRELWKMAKQADSLVKRCTYAK